MESKEYLIPNITNNKIIKILKNKIKNEHAFCITRFGDGEIGILKDTRGPHSLRRFCYNWGFEYETTMAEGIREFKKIIQKAIIYSDVIGLINPNTRLVDYKPEKWSFTTQYIKSLGLSNPIVCDHQICRSKELGNIFSFKEILSGKPLHIISPNIKNLSPWISNILEVDVTFTDHTNINTKNRQKIIDNFHKIKAPVVIFGTGIMKDYGSILSREYGKIAIDFGATLDAWAGKRTRPWFTPTGPQGHLLVAEKFKK